MKSACVLAAVLVACAAPAAAQTTDAFTKAAKQQFELVKGNVVKAAEKMPEEHYAFKPTPEVRSFGQMVAHVADANQMICAIAGGTTPPTTKVENNKTTKADLQAALTSSFSACDAAFAAMTEAKAAEMVKFFAGEQPRLSVLSFNTAHNFEHYGNMVTYMRMKGLVPPSSEPRPKTN